MARVVGIGGHFVRSADPVALAAWYAEALGMAFDDLAVVLPDPPDGGYSVFATFAQDSDYIGDPTTQQAMCNLRVDDLAGVLARLERLGVAHEEIADGPYGRFSWTHDLDGNRVELWEPRLNP